MDILFLDSPSFGKQDMLSAMREAGIRPQLFDHPAVKEFPSKEFDDYFDSLFQGTDFAFAFSFNYYPAISAGCLRHEVKYLAFVYDNPLVALYSYTLINPCNYVFLFDKATYYDFVSAGIQTVHYLPLCANPDRLTSMRLSRDKAGIVSSDVSFVGALYNEAHNFLDRMGDLSDYSKGYLKGIMQAQMQVSGYYFIEELLTSPVLDDMRRSLPYQPLPGGTETDTYIYAYYFIARKLTSMERQEYLDAVSRRFSTKLYTHQATPDLPQIQNMGPIDYYDVMPHIFRNSKINLNISLRSIRTGIPLRAFDIIGTGGFLLSNYQADFTDCFVPDEDFVYFDGKEDLIQKIDYYLSHDKERVQIAENGLRKVRQAHTYRHRLQSMLETADIPCSD